MSTSTFFAVLTSKPLVLLARYITKFGRLVQTMVTLTYSASMTPDLTLGSVFRVTITDAVAMAMNAPTGTPQTGEVIAFIIRNTSGGAAGALTWNAVFKLSAWTQPATGNYRSITFRFDGTNWVQMGGASVDIAV